MTFRVFNFYGIAFLSKCHCEPRQGVAIEFLYSSFSPPHSLYRACHCECRRKPKRGNLIFYSTLLSLWSVAIESKKEILSFHFIPLQNDKRAACPSFKKFDYFTELQTTGSNGTLASVPLERVLPAGVLETVRLSACAIYSHYVIANGA